MPADPDRLRTSSPCLLRVYEPPPRFVQLRLPLDAAPREWRITVPPAPLGSTLYLSWGVNGPSVRWEGGG